MKPKFTLRLKDNISNTEADNCKQKVLKLHPDTKAKEKVVKALRVAKEEELSITTKYCQDKNVCGYSAVTTGLFPSIKDARTNNKQLDEHTSTTKSKRNDCKILSNMEEHALVRFLKNKSRSMQGATHAETTKYIHDILHVREHLNKQCKGGWAYQLISDNGKKF